MRVACAWGGVNKVEVARKALAKLDSIGNHGGVGEGWQSGFGVGVGQRRIVASR